MANEFARQRHEEENGMSAVLNEFNVENLNDEVYQRRVN